MTTHQQKIPTRFAQTAMGERSEMAPGERFTVRVVFGQTGSVYSMREIDAQHRHVTRVATRVIRI